MNTDSIIASLAAELGIADATIRVWRHRGAVPHRRRDDIRDLAAARNIILRREHFDAFGGRQVAA